MDALMTSLNPKSPCAGMNWRRDEISRLAEELASTGTCTETLASGPKRTRGAAVAAGAGFKLPACLLS
jgi:hypothetical protein